MVPTKNRFALTGLALILLLPLGDTSAKKTSKAENREGNIQINAADKYSKPTGPPMSDVLWTQNTLLTLSSAQDKSAVKNESAIGSVRENSSEPAREGLREKTGRLLRDKLGPRLGIFVLSMLPISELRGAMLLWAFDPVTNSEVPWWQAALIALVGNLIPVIPILFLLDWIMKLVGRIGIFSRFFDWLVARARRRGGLVERYEYLGVFLFVAIPLPFTGAWTGALVSSVLRLNPWKSFLVIITGVLTADVVVTSFVLLKWWGLLAAVIVLPVLWFLSRWLEKKGKQQASEWAKK